MHHSHKNWLSFWVRNAAKRKCTVLTRLREEVSRRVGAILESSHTDHFDVTCVRESLTILRLFTARHKKISNKLLYNRKAVKTFN